MEQLTGKVLRGFYALEGIDGAGKTTLLSALKDMCRGDGTDNALLFHAEPTGSTIGLACRNALIGGRDDYPPSVAAYLLAADRYGHLYGKDEGVLPLLERGKMVITDRYLYSSIVYQTCMEDGREGLEQRRLLAETLNGFFEKPEKVFFLKCDPCLALERQRKRGKEPIDSIGRLRSLDMRYELLFAMMEKAYKWSLGDSSAGHPEAVSVVRLDASRDAGELAGIVYGEIFC